MATDLLSMIMGTVLLCSLWAFHVLSMTLGELQYHANQAVLFFSRHEGCGWST